MKYISKINKGGNDLYIKDIEARETYHNALNQAAMLMLAQFSGLPLKLNNPEWKYVYTDFDDKILFGKKQDNTWTFGDTTDDLLDEVLDLYAEDDTLFGNIYRLSVVLSLVRMSGTLSEIQNPEWLWVVLDSEDKVLMGIKTDYTWYLEASINELLDCVLDTYEQAGKTYGAFADRPTNPNTGQMYFATDKGYPVWYNGTAWINPSSEVMPISSQSISVNTSSSCSITGSGNAGKSETVIYVNSGSADVTVTVPTTYSTPDGAAIELTCPVGGYCEVSYLNIGGTIYARGL